MCGIEKIRTQFGRNLNAMMFGHRRHKVSPLGRGYASMGADEAFRFAIDLVGRAAMYVDAQ